jgi:hypothetical protein
MSDRPLALHIPAFCERCHAANMVKLQQTIRGAQIVLQWLCGACKAEWPVRRRDEEPGRRVILDL